MDGREREKGRERYMYTATGIGKKRGDKEGGRGGREENTCS